MFPISKGRAHFLGMLTFLRMVSWSFTGAPIKWVHTRTRQVDPGQSSANGLVVAIRNATSTMGDACIGQQRVRPVVPLPALDVQEIL